MNRKARILCVDDDAETLQLLQAMLHKYDVMLAGSAEEGLQTLENWDADLVITDLRMPGMSGLDFFNELRDWDTELPIIILSGHGKDIDESLSSRATMVIGKPFHKDVLLKAIRKAISERSGMAA